MMKNEKPLISVIMAEYNTDVSLLKESIQSILNQSLKNFEFIIIDDCGKNNVKKIVEEFNDTRIKVYKNDYNRGLVYSLNRAIDLSKADYVARMDTDDIAYPRRLELEYNFIKNNSQYSIVGMRCDYYDGKKIYGTSTKVGIVTREDLLNFVPYVHPTVIMKKSDVVSCNKYPNYKRCEDYALWINMFSLGYSGYVMNDIGLRYTIRKEDFGKRKLKTRKDLFRLINSDYKKLNPTKMNILKIKLKNIIAGLTPAWLLNIYNIKKYRKENS